MLVDGLEGPAFHLSSRTNLVVVVVKTSPNRLGTFAQERGWPNLRLLSSRYNSVNCDYHFETAEGVQRAVLHVFIRHDDDIRHHWKSEITFKSSETSSLDPIWSMYGVLDVTPEGRGDRAAFISLQYQAGVWYFISQHSQCLVGSWKGVGN